MSFETFAPLIEIPFISHAFTLRAAEDTKADDYEFRALAALGFPPGRFASAEQTHGNGVAAVIEPTGERVPMVDALVTASRGLPLVIRCADCAAVFIVDRRTPAIGLAHSGKKGTVANVVGQTVAMMTQQLGTNPGDCRAFIGPSIGPCHYEMDIWSGIEGQLHQAGVRDIHNPRVCTACHLDRYFSYRAEKGHTGRMLAVLALNPP
ncbi:MAG TPA: polyphenol oxidase family protein [Verrucomicrobiae bacterium]|nr:polyphenol oxidase family protein [Verrucomicrobiae bacterium]